MLGWGPRSPEIRILERRWVCEVGMEERWWGIRVVRSQGQLLLFGALVLGRGRACAGTGGPAMHLPVWEGAGCVLVGLRPQGPDVSLG